MIKKLLIVVIAIGLAYVAGYWPQRQKLATMATQTEQLQEQLERAQTVARISYLENTLLSLIDQTENRNYGEAQKLSMMFFDSLQREVGRDKTVEDVSRLQAILSRRDDVTAGLARADTMTLLILQRSLGELRDLLLQLSSEFV